MAPERIGRVIRALRHRRGWTQAEVGRRAGCSASVISRLEAGTLRACSTPRLGRVLEALGARLVLLVDWRGGELDRLLDETMRGSRRSGRGDGLDGGRERR